MRVRLSPATPLIPFGVPFEIATSRFGVSLRTRTTSVSPRGRSFDVECTDLARPRAGPFPIVIIANRIANRQSV